MTTAELAHFLMRLSGQVGGLQFDLDQFCEKLDDVRIQLEELSREVIGLEEPA